MIFAAERFHSLHTVSDDVLALFASRRAESNVARLTIRVSLVHRKTDVVVLEFAIALERDATCALPVLAVDAGSQKRVATLGAEEVLFVVCTLSELRVVKGDEALVDDWRLAMIATRGEALDHRSRVSDHRPGRQNKRVFQRTSW